MSLEFSTWICWGSWETTDFWRDDSEEGRRATPFDVRIDPNTMDLLSPQGFANALHAVCCLKPGSATLAAPVCSTFVFMTLDHDS